MHVFGHILAIIGIVWIAAFFLFIGWCELGPDVEDEDDDQSWPDFPAPVGRRYPPSSRVYSGNSHQRRIQRRAELRRLTADKLPHA